MNVHNVPAADGPPPGSAKPGGRPTQQPPGHPTEVIVSSFGDVLRTVSPRSFPSVPAQVQGAVTAALNWFVVEAPEVCASHCVGLVNPPVPDVFVGVPELTVQSALKPATFRKHVRRLREVVEACEEPRRMAYNALSREDKLRVYGAVMPDGGADRRLQIRDLLGPLVDDFVFARSWLAAHGTKAGYWSYRWLHECLDVAAIDSAESRAALASELTSSAEAWLHDYFDEAA